jgi:hypothetical protein
VENPGKSILEKLLEKLRIKESVSVIKLILPTSSFVDHVPKQLSVNVKSEPKQSSSQKYPASMVPEIFQNECR